MTIKDFSVKYRIPYYMAYEASYGVLPCETKDRCKDFSEEAMVDNLLSILGTQMKKAEAKATKTGKKIMEVQKIAARSNPS